MVQNTGNAKLLLSPYFAVEKIEAKCHLKIFLLAEMNATKRW